MDNNHAKIEKEIAEDLEKVVSIYFKEFLNKFDNLSNGLKIVDVILKAYQTRYEKYREKFSSINDIISSKYEEQREILMKSEKLEVVENKLSQVEIKLQNIMERIDRLSNESNEKLETGQTESQI
jgi:hypothetical protein